MTLQPLEVLFEEQPLPMWELPARLKKMYGGAIGFNSPVTYANFVTSLDGVAALPEIKDSPAVISGKSEADRFVMGLLRAAADVVVIGAGTLRNAVRHLWTSDYVYPELAEDFRELRRTLGKASDPALVVLTTSGNLPLSHPALEKGAIILTNEQTGRELSGRLPGTCRVKSVGNGSRLDVKNASRFLDSEGFETVLSEAGPSLFGQLLDAGLVDELFLTSSPILAGRGGKPRPGIVDGLELLPDREAAARLISVRRSESLLLLRYQLDRATYHSL